MSLVPVVLESPLHALAGAEPGVPGAEVASIAVPAMRLVTIEQCPEGHGLWLTESELHALAKRARNSWIGRYFYRPRLT